MASKSFKARPRAAEFSFDLEGAGGNVLTVRCQPSVPGAVFLDLIAEADEDDPAAMARATKDILNQCVMPDQHDEFWAFTKDPANNVDIEMLSEIAGYLSEMYAGERPTEPSAPSSAG